MWFTQLAILAAEDAGAMSTVREWVKLAADYGASWVFTVVSLGVIIYVAVSMINLAKLWVPIWMQASIDSQKRVAVAVESLVEQVACVHENSHATMKGLREAVVAAMILGRKAKEPWPSDALLQLKNAGETLDTRQFRSRSDDTERS